MEHAAGAAIATRREFLPVWVQYALVVVAVLCAHGAMLARQFVWDDTLILEHMDRVGAWRVFQPDPFGFVRPGKMLLFAICREAFGNHTVAWHAVSLGALAAACLFLLRFLREWVGDAAALAGALMYAVHPLHVEDAGWIAASNGIWLTCFGLLYLLIMLRRTGRERFAEEGDESRSWALRALWSTLVLLAALMMKEEAVVLPLLGAVCLWYRRGAIKRPVLILFAFQLIFAAALLGCAKSLSGQETGRLQTSLPALPKWEISLSAGRVLLSHAGYWLWPFRWEFYRTFDYSPRWFLVLSVLCALIVIGAAVAIWRGRKSRLSFDSGVIYFAVAMVPLCNVVPLGNDHFGVRYLSNSGVGLALASAAILDRVLVSRAKLAAAVAVGVWLLAAIATSNFYHMKWRSNETLFSELRAHAESARVEQLRAVWAYRSGHAAEAADAAERALRLVEREDKKWPMPAELANSIKTDVLVIMGHVLMDNGNTTGALESWERAMVTDQGSGVPAVNLADAAELRFERGRKREDFAAAERLYLAASRGLVAAESAYTNWGFLYVADKQTRRAAEVWAEGLSRFQGSEKLKANLETARRELASPSK